ncbi:hypothetical protein LINPERHAP2_LOCUS42482 [Linum perenne]
MHSRISIHIPSTGWFWMTGFMFVLEIKNSLLVGTDD